MRLFRTKSILCSGKGCDSEVVFVASKIQENNSQRDQNLNAVNGMSFNLPFFGSLALFSITADQLVLVPLLIDVLEIVSWIVFSSQLQKDETTTAIEFGF